MMTISVGSAGVRIGAQVWKLLQEENTEHRNLLSQQRIESGDRPIPFLSHKPSLNS